MLSLSPTYTDLYQLSMAQVYFLKGAHQYKAVFDYFFRKLPFSGGYVVFCGLEELLDILEDFRFTAEDLDYLKAQGFHPDFLQWLRTFRFRGNISSCREGELIFPGVPVLQLEGHIIEAQLAESLLLNLLNFSSLVATKARRMYEEAQGKTLVELGLRRAQGLGAYHASRAAIVGGFQGSSNVRAGIDFGIPISGSMAHAFIQSYDSEYDAFSDFAQAHPEATILLVDTYNTIESGIPNAIKVAREMESRGHRLTGIRLDSGDLAYLSRKARAMLDAAGLQYVKIAVSNQLDEFIIRSLETQQAPIDIYGVGTSLSAAKPDAALDGVYKLAWYHDKPRMKISETLAKVTLPGRKQVYRMEDASGHLFGADGIALKEEKMIDKIFHPLEPERQMDTSKLSQRPLLQPVMQEGKRLNPPQNPMQLREQSLELFQALPEEYKRLEYPHLYKVGISEALLNQRNELLQGRDTSLRKIAAPHWPKPGHH